MKNIDQQKVINTGEIVNSGFLCVKSLYLTLFSDFASIIYVDMIDGEKACKIIKERFENLLTTMHSYTYFNKKKVANDFSTTVLVFSNSCILEFGTGYCEIYHNGKEEEFVKECVLLMKDKKQRQRKAPLEINLISTGRHGLELKQIEVKRTKLDIDLFYEDDFKEVDEVILKRLKRNNDKGIVLLHGLPGTGKTTYLRYLIGRIKKRILFVSPAVAADITNPEFIDLLVSNPNSVLIIEDAENVIMDRRFSSNASVSNLLNISDGLLADFLNVQLICTFNSPVAMVDAALMRKGRLIAKYEFGKLSVEKATKLSTHFGKETEVTGPMTLAEIANPEQKDAVINRQEVIGFRRKEIMLN